MQVAVKQFNFQKSPGRQQKFFTWDPVPPKGSVERLGAGGGGGVSGGRPTAVNLPGKMLSSYSLTSK